MRDEAGGRPGTFVKLWDTSGDSVCCVAEDEPRIDAAVTAWLSSGKTADSILDLTLESGDGFRILASAVVSWIVSTPEGRLRATECDAAHKAEAEEFRAAAGIWEDDT